MRDPNITTKVVHSKSKDAFNIVGTKLGAKYKITRVPYVRVTDTDISNRNRDEALEHANFINRCFNNSGIIVKQLKDANRNK